MMTEHIRHEQGNPDAWACLCGNTPSDDGFYPIDDGSHEVEPTAKDWTTNHYFCARCGRVIDPDSLTVVRRVDPSKIVKLV
jgi:hypothetical protein